MLFLDKSQIRLRMGYCCCILLAAVHSQSNLCSVQNCIRSLMDDELFSALQSLSHRRNVARLLRLYFNKYGERLEELYFFVPPARAFRAWKHHPVLTEKKHTSFPSCFFHKDYLFKLIITLWKKLPRECSPDNYSLDLFVSRSTISIV